MPTTVFFLNNFPQVRSNAQCQKIGKPNDINVFGIIKTKGQHDSHNRLRSSIPEGGLP